ncbi:MAG: alpha/beta hydrolase [Deltaproteobacteria bacterium]|nr:alpha/beta hydrolase [Deltaproteobacteria bacterium]
MLAPLRAKTVKNPGKLVQLVKTKEGYATSFDGTKIHYRSVGQGTPIICCNGLGVPSFFWKYLENFFKQEFQVIVWDYRGHGNSAAPKKMKDVSVNALVEDCKAVVDALKIKKAVFIGFSLGTQIIFEFYRRNPKHVIGLVPCMGTYGHPMDTFYNSPFSKYIYEIITVIGSTFPKQGNMISRFLLKNPFWYQLGGLLRMVDTGMASKDDVKRYIDHILDLDPEFFTNLLTSVQEHTTEDILKKIKVPTLIMGAEFDQFTPVWISKKMHRLIPKSELLIVKKATHPAIVEQPELINLRIDKFIRERVLPNEKKN